MLHQPIAPVQLNLGIKITQCSSFPGFAKHVNSPHAIHSQRGQKTKSSPHSCSKKSHGCFGLTNWLTSKSETKRKLPQ